MGKEIKKETVKEIKKETVKETMNHFAEMKKVALDLEKK